MNQEFFNNDCSNNYLYCKESSLSILKNQPQVISKNDIQITNRSNSKENTENFQKCKNENENYLEDLSQSHLQYTNQQNENFTFDESPQVMNLSNQNNLNGVIAQNLYLKSINFQKQFDQINYCQNEFMLNSGQKKLLNTLNSFCQTPQNSFNSFNQQYQRFDNNTGQNNFNNNFNYQNQKADLNKYDFSISERKVSDQNISSEKATNNLVTKSIDLFVNQSQSPDELSNLFIDENPDIESSSTYFSEQYDERNNFSENQDAKRKSFVKLSKKSFFDLKRLILPYLKENYDETEYKYFLNNLTNNILKVKKKLTTIDLSNICGFVVGRYPFLLENEHSGCEILKQKIKNKLAYKKKILNVSLNSSSEIKKFNQ